MPLPPELVARLVCPLSKQPLVYFPRGSDGASEANAFLLRPASRRRYRIDQGVAVLLVDEALEVSEAEVTYLVECAAKLGLGAELSSERS